MKTHIKETIESLIKYRNLFTEGENEYRKANFTILTLILTFAPFNQIEQFKTMYL